MLCQSSGASNGPRWPAVGLEVARGCINPPPSGTPALTRACGFARRLGGLSSGAAVGIRGGWEDRPEAHLRALGRVCMPSEVPALPPLPGDR